MVPIPSEADEEARRAHREREDLTRERRSSYAPTIDAILSRRAQPVGGSLQRGDIVHRQEGIVVLAEADLRSGKFAVRRLNTSLSTAATPTRKKCTTCSGRDRALR